MPPKAAAKKPSTSKSADKKGAKSADKKDAGKDAGKKGVADKQEDAEKSRIENNDSQDTYGVRIT